MYTDAEQYTYHASGVPLNDGKSITFNVNTKSDAHIGLSKNNLDGSIAHEDINIYEIVIGGWLNTLSIIRDEKQGPMKCQANTPGILTYGIAQPFWVSWDNGNIRVGREHQVGNHVICEWQDPTPKTINYVSMTTAWGPDGKWIFPNKGVIFLLYIILLL